MSYHLNLCKELRMLLFGPLVVRIYHTIHHNIFVHLLKASCRDFITVTSPNTKHIYSFFRCYFCFRSYNFDETNLYLWLIFICVVKVWDVDVVLLSVVSSYVTLAQRQHSVDMVTTSDFFFPLETFTQKFFFVCVSIFRRSLYICVGRIYIHKFLSQRTWFRYWYTTNWRSTQGKVQLDQFSPVQSRIHSMNYWISFCSFRWPKKLHI